MDFLVDARGEVSFSAQNMSLMTTRAGVVTFARNAGEQANGESDT